MPVTVNHLMNGHDDSNASVYTTGSASPTPMRLQLLSVYLRRSGTAPSTGTTISGCGLTWVQVATVNNNTGTSADRIILFRAMGGGATPGTLTITCPETEMRCGWDLNEFDNIDRSGSDGANAIVQSANDQNGGTTGTGATVTLAAFASSNNATFGTIGTEAAGVISPGAGFTELNQEVIAALSRLQTEWKNSSDTSVDWTWASVSLTYVALALEIKFVPPSGGFLTSFL